MTFIFTKTHKFVLKSPGLQFAFEGEISAAIFMLSWQVAVCSFWQDLDQLYPAKIEDAQSSGQCLSIIFSPNPRKLDLFPFISFAFFLRLYSSVALYLITSRCCSTFVYLSTVLAPSRIFDWFFKNNWLTGMGWGL